MNSSVWSARTIPWLASQAIRLPHEQSDKNLSIRHFRRDRQSVFAPEGSNAAFYFVLYGMLVEVNEDLQRSIDQAVEQERKRLIKIEQVRKFLSDCDEDQIQFLNSVFRNGGGHSMSKGELPGRKILTIPLITIPDYGPITDRGTPRQRAWGILFPAVEQAIQGMEEISSTGVYTLLKAGNFNFSTERPVSSIAAVLRTLKSDGVLEVSPSWKRGSRPVFFRKKKSYVGQTHLGSRRAAAGSLTDEAMKCISTEPEEFTTRGIVKALRNGGFKFVAKSPTVAVNGVFSRLMELGKIRIVKKGIGQVGHSYARTAKWKD
jgi:hypothetical protein